MKKFELKFKILDKGVLSFLTNAMINETHTIIIAANSERDAQKRLELMYPDKHIKVDSCKHVW